jgi:hypothetical protein
MAKLDPAIHVFLDAVRNSQDVDAHHKAGHDAEQAAAAMDAGPIVVDSNAELARALEFLDHVMAENDSADAARIAAQW